MPPPTSGPPAMAKQATPKTMSSRLMTMKFMQRGAAAAAAAAATSNTPTTSNSPVNTPSNDGPTKRRKVSHTPSTSGAGSPATTPLFDQQAIKAALEQEEKRNRAAIERRAAELGDSHWVLEGAASAPPRIARPLLNVVPVGFAQIDGSTAATASGQDVYDDDPFDMGGVSARPQFQRFNMKKSKATKGDDDEGKSDSESGSGSESGEASDNDRSPRASSRADTGRGRQSTVDRSDRKRARSSVSGRREEERRKAHQLAGKRRKKEIKLNQLSSISSAGSQGFQRPSAVLSCHGCGKPGHKVADCPNRKR